MGGLIAMETVACQCWFWASEPSRPRVSSRHSMRQLSALGKGQDAGHLDGDGLGFGALEGIVARAYNR